MSTISFDQLVAAWLRSLSSPNTKAAYQRDLEVFARWAAESAVRPTAARPADIEAFSAHCVESGSGSSTVNRRLAAVTSFYRFAAPHCSFPNPARDTARRPTATEATAALSAADRASVWSAAQDIGGKSEVIIALVMHDGLKCKDILLIDADHLRRSPTGIVLSGTTLDPRTAASIRSHLRGRRTGPLLLNEGRGDEPGSRLGRFGVDYLVKRVGVRAGLAVPLTVNALRASRPDGDEVLAPS